MPLTPPQIIDAIRAVEKVRSPISDFQGTDTERQAEERKRQKRYFQACERLCEQLHQSDPQDVFNVLFPLACSRSKEMLFYGLHALAGHLLFQLKPPCPVPCLDALRSVCTSDWDLSLQEMPWYLAAVFRVDTLHQSLAELEAEDIIKQQRKEQQAWHASHSQLRTFNDWKEVWQQSPPGYAVIRLDTVRYWLKTFEDSDSAAAWQPLWR